MRPTFWLVVGAVLLLHLALLRATSPRFAASAPANPAQAWRLRAPSPIPATAPTAAALPVPTHSAQHATRPITPLAARPGAAAPVAPPASSVDKAQPTGSVKLPGAVRLHYVVQGTSRGVSYDAHATLTWMPQGDRYEAALDTGTANTTTRQQRSQGRVDARGLAPQRFGDKLRAEQAAHFDAEKGMVSFSSNAASVPLPAGAQDRLSLMLQLSALFAGDARRYPEGAEITLPVVGTRDAQVWTFVVGAMQTLNTPGGEVPAIVLTRHPRQEYDPRMELWLSPQLHYLPVRWRMTLANGDVVDQLWQRSETP